jgi:hypothetical protein
MTAFVSTCPAFLAAFHFTRESPHNDPSLHDHAARVTTIRS